MSTVVLVVVGVSVFLLCVAHRLKQKKTMRMTIVAVAAAVTTTATMKVIPTAAPTDRPDSEKGKKRTMKEKNIKGKW